MQWKASLSCSQTPPLERILTQCTVYLRSILIIQATFKQTLVRHILITLRLFWVHRVQWECCKSNSTVFRPVLWRQTQSANLWRTLKAHGSDCNRAMYWELPQIHCCRLLWTSGSQINSFISNVCQGSPVTRQSACTRTYRCPGHNCQSDVSISGPPVEVQVNIFLPDHC
jgi:hypothetical protein